MGIFRELFGVPSKFSINFRSLRNIETRLEKFSGAIWTVEIWIVQSLEAQVGAENIEGS